MQHYFITKRTNFDAVNLKWSSVLENIAEARTSSVRKVVIKKASLFSSALRPDINQLGRSNAEFSHKVVIAVRQLNLGLLEALVHNISNPDSKNYGQHQSITEIHALTSNDASTNYIMEYLERTWPPKQFTMEKSFFGDFITG